MRSFDFLALIALGTVSTAGSGGIVVPNGSYTLKSASGEDAGGGYTARVRRSTGAARVA